jgi:hypothetical protein
LIPHHIQTAAHWVAHELEIRSGETCLEGGYAVGLKDILRDKKRVPFAQATFEDIWTDGGEQVGVVRSLVDMKSGHRELDVDYFEPRTCKSESKRVTGGICYR